MYCRRIITLGGAVLAMGATASGALAAGTTVTVRVEGKNKTLLAAKSVTPHAGVVKKAGHSCTAASGAGALNVATHGAWSATWFSSLGFEVTKILGEADQFSTTHSYWEIFVGNVASQSGLCAIKLHRGEQILFAAVPATGTVFPLELTAPRSAAKGHAFTVTVKAFDAHGKAKALAGAKVNGATTNRQGRATITLTRSATLTAAKKGFIRAEAQVRVS
jgi:hypothetical protein